MGIFGFDSPLVRVLNRITDLVVLNILTLVLCLPVLSAGAALCALHGVCMQMARDEEGQIVPGFFRFLKRDFKQATAVWLLFLCACALLVADAVIFRRMGASLFDVQAGAPSGAPAGGTPNVQTGMLFRVLTMVILAVLFVLWMIFQYAFPLTARYDNRLRDTLRNALLTSVIAFPRTVLMLLIDAFVFFWIVSPFAFYALPFLLLIGVSGPAYLKAMLYRPVLERLEAEKGDVL